VSSATRRINNTRSIERIADAVLYEGYILYPYRPSSVKNQQRWNFGVLSPEAYAVAQGGSESSSMLTECLVEIDSSSTLEVKIRFLHLMLRELAEEIEDCRSFRANAGHFNEGSLHFRVVPAFEFKGRILQPWQEAVDREVVIPRIKLNDLGLSQRQKFDFPSSKTTEPLMPTESGKNRGLILRTQDAIVGEIELLGIARDEGVEMRLAPVDLGAQDAAKALGLLLARAEGAADLDRHLGRGQVDGEVGDLADH